MGRHHYVQRLTSEILDDLSNQFGVSEFSFA
jgi:hypothetical protein